MTIDIKKRKEFLKFCEEQGIPTLRVETGEKKPLGKYSDASTNKENYELSFFKNGDEYYNIGVLAGSILKNGKQLVILDVDFRVFEPECFKLLKEIQNEGETFKVLSASNNQDDQSCHLYYEFDGEINGCNEEFFTGKWKITKGIELFACTTMNVAPTSYNKEKDSFYRIAEDSVNYFEHFPQCLKLRRIEYLEEQKERLKKQAEQKCLDDNVFKDHKVFCEDFLLALGNKIEPNKDFVDNQLWNQTMAVCTKHLADLKLIQECFKKCGVENPNKKRNYKASEITNYYLKRDSYIEHDFYSTTIKSLWRHNSILELGLQPEKYIEEIQFAFEGIRKTPEELVLTGLEHYDQLRKIIYEHAHYKYPSFVDAVALAFISTHLQLLVQTPTYSCVSLYQTLVGETSSGKSFYTDFLLSNCNNEKITGQPKTGGGLHKLMLEKRSAIVVLAEGVGVIRTFKSDHGLDLLGKLCALWNGGITKTEAGDVTKSEEYKLKNLNGWALNFLSTMTPNQARKYITEETSEAGFWNRQLLLVAENYEAEPKYKNLNFKTHTNDLFKKFVDECKRVDEIRWNITNDELVYNGSMTTIKIDEELNSEFQRACTRIARKTSKEYSGRLYENSLRVATLISAYETCIESIKQQKPMEIALNSSCYISKDSLKFAYNYVLKSVETTIEYAPKKKETKSGNHKLYREGLKKQFKKGKVIYKSNWLSSGNTEWKLNFLKTQIEAGQLKLSEDGKKIEECHNDNIN